MSGYSADQLIAKYIQLRDEKAALAAKHSEEMKPFNTALETLEAALMDILNAQGGQNIKTTSGTAYRTEIMTVKVEDWPSYYSWVQAFGTSEFLVKSANKTAVKEYMEAHDTLPIGLSTSTMYNLNVRRS